MAPAPEPTKVERIPALDGLRAVAIVMVIAYHASRDVMPAGFWGVTVFFVLSGYLITRLLCAEHSTNGSISVRSFYWKRGVRLMPALIVVSLVVLALGQQWLNVLPALGYYANYARIGGSDLGLLTHTWSLAVEEHFYLLWPVVLAWVPPAARRRVLWWLLAVALLWRALAIVILSEAWVYNSTDTNAAALLAGCYLAVSASKPNRWFALCVPALVVLAALPYFGHDSPMFLWGGFLAIALGVGAVNYATTRARWLELAPVVWVGKISYGLYLWHYVLIRSDLSIWLALPLTLLLAAASWYLVEEPIRKWRTAREKDGRVSRPEAGAVDVRTTIRTG